MSDGTLQPHDLSTRGGARRWLREPTGDGVGATDANLVKHALTHRLSPLGRKRLRAAEHALGLNGPR